jgi:uncharacterized membrane protein YidH (DUF202 family)
MADQKETRKNHSVQHRRVHMANERTFLAWVRTSIAVMAFGFVVERFSLFTRQLSVYFGKEVVPQPPHGLSSAIGIVLVGLGALIGVLSYVRFRRVERQIEEGGYQPSMVLGFLLTLSILTIGVFLIFYLFHSMP